MLHKDLKGISLAIKKSIEKNLEPLISRIAEDPTWDEPNCDKKWIDASAKAYKIPKE